mgnify:CR=1 FL=1
MTRASCSPPRAQFPEERVGVIAAGDDDQPDAHIERPQHVVAWNVAAALQPREDRRHLPRGGVYDCGSAARQHARQIVGNPAARDVGHPLDAASLQERLDDRQVGAMRLEQRLADRP